MRTEWFPLVNEEGETIGKATRKECHSGSKLLHPVIIYISLIRMEIYIYKKRSMNKDIQPGKWDTAVGGHIDYGESVEEALRREVREELGITDFTPVFIKRYIFESSIEKELVNSFRTTYDGPITPDPEELDGGRFLADRGDQRESGGKAYSRLISRKNSPLFSHNQPRSRG